MKSIFLFFPPSAAAKALLFVIISVFSVSGIGIWPIFVYAAGPTAVEGEIATSTLWDSSGSPYVISGIMTVVAGSTLTIAPGVVVKFGPNSALNVYGGLLATGTVEKPIYFTSANDGIDEENDGTMPSSLDPWSIAFLTASSSSITNAIIRYGNGGIFALNSALTIASTSFSDMNGQLALDASTLTAQNLSFARMNRGALSIYASSTARVSGMTVNQSMTDAIAVYQTSRLVADHISVMGETKGVGLTVFDSSSAQCDQCSFSNILNKPTISVYSGGNLSLSSTTLEGGTNGIVAFGSVTLTLTNDIVRGFSNDGIQAFNGPVLDAQLSIFENNQNAGIEVWGDVNGGVHNDFFTGNGQGIMSRTTIPFVATNSWWGSASGPFHSTLNPNGTGDAVSDGVIFSPWLTSRNVLPVQKVTPLCCSSVLFIPGLEASRLYATSSTLLGGLMGSVKENQLWEPGLSTPVNQLFLDKKGNSINSVYTKDAIKTTNEIALNQDIYQHFSDTLDGLVASGTIATWQAYPYDWRLDPQSLVTDGTRLAHVLSKLEPMVLALAGTSKTGKVTIVAHSNGGILAKLLLNKLQADGKSALVDTLALVAVPQLGTPLAIPALLSGYGQSLGWGWLLDETTAQQLAQNMPSAYTLLPSATYFSAMGPAVLFDSSLDLISNLHKVYGAAISNATSLTHFLTATGDRRTTNQPLLSLANDVLTSTASALHNVLDAWQPPAGVALMQIAGVGLNTLSATEYYARATSLSDFTPAQAVLDMKPHWSALGDNTVLAGSGAANSSAATYYVDLARYNASAKENRGHSDMLEVKPVEQLLASVFAESTTSFSVLPQFVSTGIPEAYTSNTSITTEISVHSPVTLDIYDDQGRHVGASSTPNQIPNSYYLPFGEGQYAGVPAGTKAKIVLSGEAVGTFTLDIATGNTKTEFQNVPILPTSIATLELASGTPALRVDYDGDGVVDDMVTATNTDSSAYLLSLKKLLTAFNLPLVTKNLLKAEIDDIVLSIKKNGNTWARKSLQNWFSSRNNFTLFRRHEIHLHGLSSDDQQNISVLIGALWAERAGSKG